MPRTRAEWRAVRAERAAEARLRAERDYVHHGEKIRAAAEARQQRDAVAARGAADRRFRCSEALRARP
jgi:hypothetical protein